MSCLRSIRLPCKALESLEILDNNTREALKEIIEIRDRITHSGRLVDPKDKTKAAKAYFKLITILTKVFLRTLVPDNTFSHQYVGPWKLVESCNCNLKVNG